MVGADVVPRNDPTVPSIESMVIDESLNQSNPMTTVTTFL